jgi:hypothetical protein
MDTKSSLFTVMFSLRAFGDGAPLTVSLVADYMQRVQNSPYDTLSELRAQLLQSADDLTWDDKAMLFAHFLGK